MGIGAPDLAAVVDRPARPAGALAAAAGLRSPAQARADRLVVRAACSLSIDVPEGLHGAANGACARRPTTTALNRCAALACPCLMPHPCLR